MENYKCPFNYVGSKSQLLPDLLNIIDNYPNETFVDLFAGGFSVGLNVKNKNIIYNDINNDLKTLIELIYNTNFADFESKLIKLINKYELSKYNSEGFLKLRIDFNSNRDSYLFCLLIFYSFNHQIRYNKKNQFNTPFGRNRSSYNKQTRINLIKFFNLIKLKEIKFYSLDFNNFPVEKNSIVYVDPPYLITVGSYNDGRRGISSWTREDEVHLYEYLDYLDKNNIKFILSNMRRRGEVENDILTNWCIKYRTKNVTTKYKNYKKGNYLEEEILVMNF